MVLPTEPGQRVASLDDVYALFNTYLGRDPDFATEALPRVGHTYLSQEAQIRCSQEAANYRANHGAEPDTWCFNRNVTTGEIIPGVPKPPPPQPPPPKSKPPGSDLPLVGGIIDALWGPIQDILTKINAVKTSLGDNIGRTLEPVLKEIAASGGRITQTLADNITQLIPRALELAAEAADKASDVAAGFVENAATLGDVADMATKAFAGNKLGLLGFAAELGPKLFGEWISKSVLGLELDHIGNTDALISMLHREGVLPPDVAEALSLVPGKTTPLHLIVGTALIMMVGSQFAQAVVGPEIAITAQKNNERAPNLILTATQAAQAAVQELRDYPAMEEIAKRNGYNADQFRVMADLAFQFPQAQTITGAALRGAITADQADAMLNRLGYNAESRDIWRAMALQLPGVQDTIRMAVREVFDPVARRALTLDADYPTDLTEHAEAIGLSEEWARNFWAAHWELPSPNQVFEMLHRGLVTLPEVDAYLKAADFAPVWRDRLRDIAYNVFTRVDIRRIHDLREKDHAWLLQQHKRLGYNDADAEELSLFVELLNSDERKTRLKDLNGPITTRIISGVVAGTLTNEQATQFFRNLGYDANDVETFLLDAALIRQGKRTDRISALLGDLYVKDRRTRLEVTTQLRERGFLDAEIDTLLREWDLEKELKAPTEKEEKERDLTRSDIEAMYRARQIERPLAQQMLLTLRYSAAEATAILDLDDFKEKQAEDKDRTEVVHRKFVKGTMDGTTAKQELGKIGLRATQIEASIARWELEVSAKTADLSVGQVGEVYKLGHWDDLKTRAYLVRLGYDEDEIGALLRTWGSKVEEQRKRDELAAARAEEARRKEAERVLLAASRKEKDLAKTDLLNAGAAGILRWDEVKLELTKRGYSAYEADVLIRTKQAQGVKKNA